MAIIKSAASAASLESKWTIWSQNGNLESEWSVQNQKNGQSRHSEWSIQSQNGQSRVDDFHAPLPMLEQWALTSIHPLRATVFSASTFQN